MKGLEDFRKAFGAYRAAYVLIGGAACDVWLAAAGLRSRATKDLDVVLIIEALNAGFIQAFRSYVDSRGYSCARNLSDLCARDRNENPI